MGGSFKIGRFSGIDVRVHWTFFLLLAFFAFIGYRASGSLFENGLRTLQQSGLRALPVTENGGFVGMLTIEDIGHARLLSRPKGR